MKKYLIASALILCMSQFALAQEEFYLIRDNTTNECRIVNGTELAATQKVRYPKRGPAWLNLRQERGNGRES